MPEPPQHQLSARPTSLEMDVQRAALAVGGKRAEVLVKAARDLVVLSAIADATGDASLRHHLGPVLARFQQYAVLAGVPPLDLAPSGARHQAALILARYLP
jgi:hypothetical protein